MKRHWSFVVCDKRFLYPLALLVLTAGVAAAFLTNDAVQMNRVGNFIVGIGVWMSLRSTLREGINRNKDYADNFPITPGTGQLNSAHFNRLAFSIGDAELQLHGFVLVIAGSIVGSFGDLIIKFLVPGQF